MERCRLCYSYKNPKLCLNIFDAKHEPSIWKIIYELTQLTIMRNDPYTKNVCYQCFDQLEKCYIFRRMILHTDWRIRHDSCDNSFNNNTERFTNCINNNFNDSDVYVQSMKIDDDNDDYNLMDQTNGIEEDPLKIENDSNDNYQIAQDDSMNIVEQNRTNNTEELKHLETTEKRINIDKNVDNKDPIRDCIKTEITSEINKKEQTTKTSKNLQHFCNICNKTFSNRNNLIFHLKVHGHGNDGSYNCDDTNKQTPQRNQQQKFDTNDNKLHQCNYCNRTFLYRSLFLIHLRSHTGERPYHCEHCGKGFAQTSGLQKHSVIHTGERPYPCDMCGKRFALKHHLTNHLKIHIGDKLYNCDMCGIQFAQMTTLQKHLNVHISEKTTLM